MSWKEITYKKIKWIDISKPTAKDIQKLWRDFGFHPLSLEDVQYTQRSKVDVYDAKYYFIILMLPIFDGKENIITPSDVNIYIGKNFLVTIHRDKILPARQIFLDAQKSTAWQKTYMADKPPAQLLYQYIESLMRYCFPILDGVNDALEKLETEIFTHQRKDTVRSILEQRRIIIDLRKIMQPHHSTLTRLHAVDKKYHLLGIAKNFEYFDNLVDYIAEMWDSLEEYKEAAEMLQEANGAIISTRINRVMKRLTLVSVIFLPIGLLAGIFGMNARYMPFIGHPMDFWIIIWIMLVVVTTTIIVFKIQDWID